MKSSWPTRVVVGFAKFWWDFLVGDTPELFCATILLLALVALARTVGHENALAAVLFPVLVAATLGLSLRRARRR